ncbi:hypothetical protein [Alkalitalea saponilacus]|nr:hypothetical protein [Alkalitalea saponilacus]ASB48565.1 hypothetical protein CDL62_05135 [Alkalitalea saponilacus]
MMKTLLIFILLSGFFSVKSQMVYHGGLQGGSIEDEVEVFWGLGGGVGYILKDNLHLFTGIGLDFIYVVPPNESRNMKDDSWSTTTVLQPGFYSGIQYNINIRYNKELRRRWGFYPDLRVYFLPYLPRRAQWIESEVIREEPVAPPIPGYEPRFPFGPVEEVNYYYHKAKGRSASDFGYGIGGGFFIGNWANYLQIHFEYNTLNPLRVISELEDYPRTVSGKGGQFILRLSGVGLL